MVRFKLITGKSNKNGKDWYAVDILYLEGDGYIRRPRCRCFVPKAEYEYLLRALESDAVSYSFPCETE